MKKWRWILAGLLALDGLLMVFAEPVMLVLEGHAEDARWGALVVRFLGAFAAFLLGTALIVVWNLEHNLPRK